MNNSVLKLVKSAGVKGPQPGRVSPMLCTLVKQPLNDPAYLYEIKWDGYRIISYVDGSRVRMDSRSALDYTKKYPPIAAALKSLKHNVVLDGEAVVFNEQGHPDFDALQNFNGHTTPINYCVFDVLWLDGYDLKDLQLVERKAILKELVKGDDVLRFSESFDDGTGLYEQIKAINLEGIVAKKKDSPYREGERESNWLKIPTRKRQEFVIGGWAESERGRSFRSLLFGAYNGHSFEWIGRSGGGYKEKDMPGILAELKKLEIKESAFTNKVLDTKGAVIHWVKPKRVANFEFATWTKSGRIRKPATFLCFRKDKKPTDVVREVVKDVENVQQIDSKPEIAKKRPSTKQIATDSNWPKILNQKITSSQEFDLSGCSIEINNVEREIWPGVTKADLIQYYHFIAPFLLPHLKDRPQSLHIKNINANAPGFYIKDMEGNQPECAELFVDERKHKKAGKRDQIEYLVCNNESTLLYMINLGCIDINPWTSRTSSPKEPDYIVIDLDPSDNDFKKVIETAKAAKEYFDRHKLKSFIKTSGKTGMHLLLPCAGIDFKGARSLGETICRGIHQLVPSITTTEVSIGLRGTKLYIDPNQNDYADTIAAPYSVRPNHVPTVSTPLEWKEVNDILDLSKFTITTILDRLSKKGDLFENYLNQKIIASNMRAFSRLL